MHKSTSNLLLQPQVKHKRLSSGIYTSPKELLNHSGRNNRNLSTESGTPGQIRIPSLTTRKPNIPTSIYGISPFSSQASTPSITSDVMMLNRKLTKGYSKFLEDRDFISRRDEERQKVQEDMKRCLANANESQKMLSNQIQKLITSTIVNDPSKRQRTALKSTDSNIVNTEVNKYDEKHKQVCSRILGGDFENNFLFMKVQKENNLNPQSMNNSSFKKPNPMSKACSFSGGNSANDYSISSRTEPKIKKSSSGVLPLSLTDLGKEKTEKQRERKLTSDEIESKVPSLIALEPESFMGNEEVESFNELPGQTLIFSQTQLCESGFENDKKGMKSSSAARSRKFLSEVNVSSQREIKTKLEETIKKSHGNVFETNFKKNIENSKKYKKPGRKYQSFTEENVETPNKATPKVNSIKTGLDKITQLCDGAIQSTSRLGHRLRQQHLRTGKDFVNLDILVEKLNYENTIENWEKSVKQANSSESKNLFGNVLC